MTNERYDYNTKKCSLTHC